MIIDEGTRVTEVTVITVFNDEAVVYQEVVHEGYGNDTRTIAALERIVSMYTISIADHGRATDPYIHGLYEEMESEFLLLGYKLDLTVHEITLDTVDWE